VVSFSFLEGAGECAALIAGHDWPSTSLGPIERWSPSLRSMVADMLHTKQPMLLFWGPELLQFYNDSFVPSFGRGKHPAALGQRARECWVDAWPVIGAQIDAVISRGEPAWFENALVPIERNGRMEEVFWTYSYSPAYDDGQIAGCLVIVTETTGSVLSARRLEALARLGIDLALATTHEDAIVALRATVAKNAADLPFLRVTPTQAPAAELREIAVDAEPGPAWPEPVVRAVTCTVGGHLFVFGLSPRLSFDDNYRLFITQLVQQIASTLRRIDNANASIAIERDRDNLLAQAPVAIALMTGPEHVYQLANVHYRELVGRDPVGKSFREAFPELRDSKVSALFDRAFETGERVVINEEPIQLDRSGQGLEVCHFNFTIEPLRADDHVYGMMVIAADITDQVRARQVLQDANRAKDEFLAMLGHELRNPLAPIVTAIELMNEKTSTSLRERTVIERQVRHVIRLVDDLLDISRITRGLLTLDKRAVDLADVVAAAVEASSHLVQQREHRLVVETPWGLIVNGDESRLVQVMSNLLTNAARYTPNGGELRVTLAKDGHEAVVRVRDSGVGIDAELLPKVFELFVQGARSADRAEGGLGLGLAIVKNLVTLHGGTVAASSDGPGKGSEITVRLPLAAREEATVAPVRPTRPATASKRLLVVDDNEDAANLLGEIARMRGHEVEIVHDPNAALDVVTTFQPEVAVLDIGLPGMDGYELARRLQLSVPACRLIALTGYGQSKDRERALAAGFSAHLVKPVRVNDLLEMIAR
jgi:signal transduction histidine kinase/CheY-like chemotaxis protein